MRSLIWDLHACPPFDPAADVIPILERYRAAGFTAVSLNVGDSRRPLDGVIRLLSSLRAQIAARPEQYALAKSASDLKRSDGKVAITFDVEGAFSIGEQLDLVDLYYTLGVRWMSFVYNRRNLVGSGVHDDVDEGLTPLGRALVERMDAIGMIKCCSHTGYRTSREVFEMSARPSILSHSNPRALLDHERNVPDDLIEACAATGGVIGINGVGLFMGTDTPAAADVFRHIDYVVNLVGPDHVGLGLDSMFMSGTQIGADVRDEELWPRTKGYTGRITVVTPEVLPELIGCMEHAGYSQHAVDGILGENFFRVAKEIWK